MQHFVRMIETHGRYVEYLQFLQTIVKSEENFIRKTQDIVMNEVGELEGWWVGGWMRGKRGWSFLSEWVSRDATVTHATVKLSNRFFNILLGWMLA